MRFMYDNIVDDSEVTLTASSEKTGYEVEEILDTRLSKRWRSTGCGSTENILVDVGAGNAGSTQTVLIAGHSFTAAADIALYSDNIAANTLTSAASRIETLTIRDEIIAKFGATGAYQYHRVHMLDTANPDGYLSMGRLFIGAYIELDPASLEGFTVVENRTDKVSITGGRQAFTQPGVGYRTFDFKFPVTSEATISKVRAINDMVGHHKPLFFMNFEDLWDYELVMPAYCLIEKPISFKHKRSQKWTYRLKLVEVK